MKQANHKEKQPSATGRRQGAACCSWRHMYTYTQNTDPRRPHQVQASQGPTCAVLQAPHNTALGAYEAPNQLVGDLKFHQSCSVALPILQLQQTGSRAQRQRFWPQPAAGRWTLQCTHCSQSGGLRSGKSGQHSRGPAVSWHSAKGCAKLLC